MEVELLLHHLAELFVAEVPAHVPPEADDRQQPHDPADEHQVAREHLGRVRLLDLDRDVFPLLPQPGAIDLADGGDGKGLLAELVEVLIDRGAEVGFDNRAGQRGRKAHRAVLQLGQLLAEGLRKEIDAQRQQLARLQPEAAEGLEALAQQLACRAAVQPAFEPEDGDGQEKAQESEQNRKRPQPGRRPHIGDDQPGTQRRVDESSGNQPRRQHAGKG